MFRQTSDTLGNVTAFRTTPIFYLSCSNPQMILVNAPLIVVLCQQTLEQCLGMVFTCEVGSLLPDTRYKFYVACKPRGIHHGVIWGESKVLTLTTSKEGKPRNLMRTKVSYDLSG